MQSSVRHNLSSNRAFKKVDRGPDEKGKGALWSVDPLHEHTFEEQDARKQAEGKLSGKKGKNPAFLEPPLKRSVKGEPKGSPLPPPLTSAPLVKREFHAHNVTAPPTTSTFTVKVEPTPMPIPVALMHPPAPRPAPPPPAGLGASVHHHPAQASSSTPPQVPSPIPPIPASVRIPIVVGPVPSTSSDSDFNAAEAKPIVLHQNTLILNPTIFSHLTAEQLRDLEALGAQKALEILQGYIVRFYKEKLKAEGGRGRGRGRGRKLRGAAPGTTRPQPSSDGLFTTAPLPMRSANAQAPSGAPTGPPATSQAVVEPPPMASLQPEQDAAPDSPIIVVDDDDEGSDAHVSKRPRLGEGSS